ncbi:cysteine hydrolase family protein [Guptibacillus hwajinpoensis]|uniref:cysteine hydrolase family protein n=1 Tax=Guptibacillus hwajinpoensis TaxID=208199 RepID=UPI001CFC507F|nr:isochorismatase family cysteine hydrolase [Pseudalkalibacillus hwajinpoensis]WLR58010.1 isochorismatase family cysteine hydrolase [Pseudalkalibacillus hwajinpoensis]
MSKKHIEHSHQDTSAALLLIDVINTMDFEDAELLARYTEKTADNIQSLKKEAKAKGMPVIYVNDNYGLWQSDFKKVINYAAEANGQHLVNRLEPEDDDYTVVKPKHSGFFSTPLSTLLKFLNVNTLILTGFAGNICVLFTANDAYMREYDLYIPSDCCASNVKEDNDYALRLMEGNLKASTQASTELNLEELIEKANQRNTTTAYEG